MNTIIIVILVLIILVIFIALALYRIVPAGRVHYVVSAGKTMVCSPDKSVRDQLPEGVHGSRWYFAIPIIRTIRPLDLTIKELVIEQETYEKNQARYNVKSSIKYRIKDVTRAAETFVTDGSLKEQLKEVVNASVRAITVKYDVVEARANKKKMSEEVQLEMEDDLEKWGLELINFQLIDFQDTEDSKIISNISRRREVEIEARTREENAEKNKVARMKEAEANEKATTREIDAEKVIEQSKQDKEREIAERKKLAEEKRFEVVRVQTIQQAEISKDQAIIRASQERETEKILKEQKQLEGEGDRLKAEEQAKGDAAPIREKGLAEAEAKEKLQAALNKFKTDAIRALVAERIVDMQQIVGVRTAEALSKADVKVFAGGEGSAQGFDLGKMISSMSVADNKTAQALLNKIARPNDLGLSQLDLTNALNNLDTPNEGVVTKK